MEARMETVEKTIAEIPSIKTEVTEIKNSMANLTKKIKDLLRGTQLGGHQGETSSAAAEKDLKNSTPPVPTKPLGELTQTVAQWDKDRLPRKLELSVFGGLELDT